MKKLVISVALLLVAAIFFGCAQVPGTAPKTEGGLKNVGVSNYLSSWEFNVDIQKGIQETADENGISVTFQDAAEDASKQVSQVKAFINSGVDGIITYTVDGVALSSTAKDAVAAGIPVVSMWQQCEGASANILVDEYQYGYTIGEMAGKWAQETFPGQEIEIALLRIQDYQWQEERGGGMRDALADTFPTGVIVTDQHCTSTEMGIKVTEAILQANPNVKIFLCDSDDTGAFGIYEALMAKVSSSDYDSYGIFAADGVEQAIALIKKGTMYRGTVDIQPKETGKLALKVLMDLVAGKPVEQDVFVSFKSVDYKTAVESY